MTKTQLINKIDIEEKNAKKNMFFLIGDMETNREKLMDIFNKKTCDYYDSVTFKYNGISLELKTKDIPKAIKNIAMEDIEIYSVYEIFCPI